MSHQTPNPAPPASVCDIRNYRPADESPCLDIFDSNRPKYFTGPERDLFAAYLRRMDQPYFVAKASASSAYSAYSAVSFRLPPLRTLKSAFRT